MTGGEQSTSAGSPGGGPARGPDESPDTGRDRGPIRVAILTVSDRCHRGEREDGSGPAIRSWCEEQGHVVADSDVVPDETEAIAARIMSWCDSGVVDVVLTTGGTGFAPRDVTPEATRAVLERLAPGIAEELRREGRAKTAFAALSRGVAGVRGRAFVANLPGSPGGVKDGLAVFDRLLGHVVSLLRGDDPPHPSGGSGEAV